MIGQESPKVYLRNVKKIGKITPLTVKKNKFKSLQFLMVQGSLNPNIIFLGEKL